MPNYCDNSLYIRGSQDELKRFKKFAGGYGFPWTNNIPNIDEKPPVFLELDLYKFIKPADNCPMSYNDYGYDWARINHGTKWGCFDTNVSEIENNRLDYHFTTAWSPFSEEVFYKMTELFPKLEFLYKYHEGGCDFYGKMHSHGEFEDGEISDHLPEFPKDNEPKYEELEEEYYELEGNFIDEFMSPTEYLTNK